MSEVLPLPHPPRIAVVLGGGGLKGLAHIGALRALAEHGIKPSIFAGTSVGALVAAAHLTGTSLDQLTEHARELRRRDLFRLNHVAMLLERMRAPSIYLEEPLRALTRRIVRRVTFDALSTPLLVNTVDVERGTQVVWGLPGFRDVHVDDAVYASCALPGFFPPGRVDGRICIDGGTIDNLPVSLVAPHADLIIAVDVGNSVLSPDSSLWGAGFASISMRAAMVMTHTLQHAPFMGWAGPPMLLVRPPVSHFGWFPFGASDELIARGYESAREALTALPVAQRASGGIFPRRNLRLAVDLAKCNGCGLCLANAPTHMSLDANGQARPTAESVEWSPADGEFVRHCPTGALSATPIEVPVKKAS